MENAELAYLLGMISGKGTIIRHENDVDIIIEIPHKYLIIEGMDAPLSVKASLDDIRNNIEPLISTRLNSTQTRNKTVIKFTKSNQEFLIREINRHFGRLTTCKDFRIPNEIFDSPQDIKREFMVGLADVTAHIRRSNIAFGLPFNHRVYIEIPVNWYMVVDIGNLLYHLDVPIHNIDWGHPNMRDPNLKDYNKGKTKAWAREHQIKIFVDEFEKIGFRIIHKQRTVEMLAETNRKEWDNEIQRKIAGARNQVQIERYKKQLGHIEIAHHKFYWETKDIQKIKVQHPMEDNERIPTEIRGKHFDSWKEICEALGYKRM